MPELSFRVHGRVQGVGFRWWTRSQAQRLGITGTVRNCDDGTVEVRARGGEEELRRFQALLLQGPPGASVDRVDSAPADGVPLGGFAIVR